MTPARAGMRWDRCRSPDSLRWGRSARWGVIISCTATRPASRSLCLPILLLLDQRQIPAVAYLVTLNERRVSIAEISRFFKEANHASSSALGTNSRYSSRLHADRHRVGIARAAAHRPGG